MTSTRLLFACPDHTPVLFPLIPNDDGLCVCSVEGCRVRGYHVKPFEATGRAATEGVYRTKGGDLVATKGTR